MQIIARAGAEEKPNGLAGACEAAKGNMEAAVRAGRSTSDRADAEALYFAHVLPAKTRMQVEYVMNRGLFTDLGIVFRTLALLWSRRAREQSARAMRDLLKMAADHHAR